jgi:hypothetical protein
MKYEKELIRFIVKSKSDLINVMNSNSPGKDYVNALERWSQGICNNCDEILEIVSFSENESGCRYKFKCGHGLNTIMIKEEIKITDSMSLASLGLDEEYNQKISARFSGERPNKLSNEILVSKRFAEAEHRPFTDFQNDEEYSSTDVIATNPDGSEVELYQVTKLYDETFWKDLYSTGAAEYKIPSIEQLIKNVLIRKNFDKKQSSKTILLIDAWPDVHPSMTDNIEESLHDYFDESNFKEIWLVARINTKLWTKQ